MPKHVGNAKLGPKNEKSSRQREMLKSRVHTFQGQDLAEPILRWLRRDDRPADDRVERLLRLEFDRRQELLPGVTGEDRAPRIVEFVNETMRLWGPWPELGADLDDGYQMLRHLNDQTPVRNANPHDWTVGWKTGLSKEASPDARLAFWNSLLLKQQGLLHVRPCARPGCNQWFFGKFDHQNFHSDKCRVAVLSADEQRKEGRKKYMRDLRQRKKLKKFRNPKGGK